MLQSIGFQRIRQFGKVDIALYLTPCKYLKLQLVVFYSNSLMLL